MPTSGSGRLSKFQTIFEAVNGCYALQYLICRWHCSSLASRKVGHLAVCSVSKDPWEGLRQQWPCVFESHSTVLLKTLDLELTVLPDVTNKDVSFASVLCWWLSFGDCAIPMAVLSVARHFRPRRPAHFVNTARFSATSSFFSSHSSIVRFRNWRYVITTIKFGPLKVAFCLWRTL